MTAVEDVLRSLRDVSAAKAREASGLSVGQAAALSGVISSRLRAIEAGAAATPWEWDVLCSLYAVESLAPTRPPGEAPRVDRCRHCHAAWPAGSPERHTGQCDLIREAAARGFGRR